MLGGEGTVDASISQQLKKAVPSLTQIGSPIPEIAEKNRGWTSLIFSVFGCLHLPEKKTGSFADPCVCRKTNRGCP